MTDNTNVSPETPQSPVTSDTVAEYRAAQRAASAESPMICFWLQFIGFMAIIFGILFCVLGFVALGERDATGLQVLIGGVSGMISGMLMLGFKAVIDSLHRIRVAVESKAH